MGTQDKLAQALRDLLNSDPDGAIAQATDAELAEAVADASADLIIRSQAAAVLGAREALAAHEAEAQAVPGGYVLVNAGALQMVRNALRRDSESGKTARGEMLDEFDKATLVAAPQPEAVREDPENDPPARESSDWAPPKDYDGDGSVDAMARRALAAQQAEPQLVGCNCRWDGRTQVQWCELHLAHKEAIHEWAGRAKTAKAELAAHQAGQQDDFPDYAVEINRLRNVIQAACSGGLDHMIERWKVLFPDAPVPTVRAAHHDDGASEAGHEAAAGHLSALVDEAQRILADLHQYAIDLQEDTLGGRSERGEVPIMDLAEDWLAARPDLEPQPHQQAEREPQWLPIETAPKDGSKMLLFYLNRQGNPRRVVGRWVTADEAAETDTDDVGLEAGWYERIDNWDDYYQVAIHEGEPTHWMPLPAAPGDRGTSMGGT